MQPDAGRHRFRSITCQGNNTGPLALDHHPSRPVAALLGVPCRVCERHCRVDRRRGRPPLLFSCTGSTHLTVSTSPPMSAVGRSGRLAPKEVAMASLTDVHGKSWYLLAHTEGYRVDSKSGERVGVVDRVQWSEGTFEFEPEALIVRSLSSAREVVVPLEQVTEIQVGDEWNRRSGDDWQTSGVEDGSLGVGGGTIGGSEESGRSRVKLTCHVAQPDPAADGREATAAAWPLRGGASAGCVAMPGLVPGATSPLRRHRSGRRAARRSPERRRPRGNGLRLRRLPDTRDGLVDVRPGPERTHR